MYLISIHVYNIFLCCLPTTYIFFGLKVGEYYTYYRIIWQIPMPLILFPVSKQSHVCCPKILIILHRAVPCSHSFLKIKSTFGFSCPISSWNVKRKERTLNLFLSVHQPTLVLTMFKKGTCTRNFLFPAEERMKDERMTNYKLCCL